MVQGSRKNVPEDKVSSNKPSYESQCHLQYTVHSKFISEITLYLSVAEAAQRICSHHSSSIPYYIYIKVITTGFSQRMNGLHEIDHISSPPLFLLTCLTVFQYNPFFQSNKSGCNYQYFIFITPLKLVKQSHFCLSSEVKMVFIKMRMILVLFENYSKCAEWEGIASHYVLFFLFRSSKAAMLDMHLK